MSIQGRSRRKKAFKPNEENRVEEPSKIVVKQERQEGVVPVSTLLNVRRSSRKPKPKQHDDEEMLFTERETTEKDNKGGSVEALVGFEGLESSENIYLGTGVKRETRKTYQNYLETLGYNTDFSKITAQESFQQAAKAKVASSQCTIGKQSKTEERLIAKQTIHIKTEPPELPEEHYLSTKVRASSRTPKPKRTFALLEDDSAVYSKQNRAGNLENVNDSHSETETKSTVQAKPRKSLPENSDKEQKSRKSRRHASSSLVHNVLSTTPLSKQDVDDTETDEHDSSLTRTSTRVRIPKRKFSLIDEESLETEVKRQRVMSPEQTIDCKVQGSKDLVDKIQEDSDINIRSRSSLVIKRSDSKKQRGNRRKEEMKESRVEHDQEKEENISKKIEFFSSNSTSHSESEKKPESKRRRPRIEAIVQKLKISKDTTLKQASKKTSIEKKTEVEEKSSTSRKTMKRKRESSNLEKSGSEKEGKGKINDSNGEHIVLKLTIPHGSPKTEEKKHHHKHHHKHKREKEGEIGGNKKNIKSEGEEDVAKAKETSSKDSQKLESEMKTKKKKKKRCNKEDSSESLSSDTSAIPHVKLVIKKSPVKSKHVEVTRKDEPSASIEPSLISQDEAVEQNVQDNQSDSRMKMDEQTKKKKDDQSDLKKKTQTKKDKPLSKRAKKRLEKLKKDAKTKTVSAYSLFTKSRRKHLLETEPYLDFATTSRRLAEMWKELPGDDQEYWRAKARVIRKPALDRKSALKGLSKAKSSTTKVRHDYLSGSHSKDSEAFLSSGTDVVDMAAYLKLLGESLCSIGMCLKRQDQMEVHGSLSVLLDTALCSIVPLFCLTSQLPEMAGCSAKTQAEILDNLAYIIPGL